MTGSDGEIFATTPDPDAKTEVFEGTSNVEETEEEQPLPIVYSQTVHLPGEEKPRKIELTEKDLDPQEDALLKPLFDLLANDGAKTLFRMPVLLGLRNYVEMNKKSLELQYSNYKKKGRL